MKNDKKLLKIKNIDDYLFSKEKESDLIKEELLILNCINNEIFKLEESFSDSDYESLEKVSDIPIKEKRTKELAKEKGMQIVRCINKCLNYKDEELAKESFPRKVLRVAIQLLLIFGPLFIPINPIKRLVIALAGVVIANSVSIKQKKDLISMYEIKLEQIERKIDNSDDDKEIYELKKLKIIFQKELSKLQKSLNAGDYAYKSNNR